MSMENAAEVLYLECRRGVWGHNWGPAPDGREWDDCVRHLHGMCRNCGARRDYGYDRYMNRLHTYRWYPEGYKIPRADMPDTTDLILTIITK